MESLKPLNEALVSLRTNPIPATSERLTRSSSVRVPAFSNFDDPTEQIVTPPYRWVQTPLRLPERRRCDGTRRRRRASSSPVSPMVALTRWAPRETTAQGTGLVNGPYRHLDEPSVGTRRNQARTGADCATNSQACSTRGRCLIPRIIVDRRRSTGPTTSQPENLCSMASSNTRASTRASDEPRQ
jgi:hypothetical protein